MNVEVNFTYLNMGLSLCLVCGRLRRVFGSFFRYRSTLSFFCLRDIVIWFYFGVELFSVFCFFCFTSFVPRYSQKEPSFWFGLDLGRPVVYAVPCKYGGGLLCFGSGYFAVMCRYFGCLVHSQNSNSASFAQKV